MDILLTENVWQTKDGRFVSDDDKDKEKTLVAKAGTRIPYADAVAYGLVADASNPKAAPAPAPGHASLPLRPAEHAPATEHHARRAEKEEDDDDSSAKHARKK